MSQSDILVLSDCRRESIIVYSLQYSRSHSKLLICCRLAQSCIVADVDEQYSCALNVFSK